MHKKQIEKPRFLRELHLYLISFLHDVKHFQKCYKIVRK